MTIYYSPSNNAFYDDVIHGTRKLAIQQTEAEAKAGKRIKMVPNPDCLLPADAYEITAEEHRALLEHQSNGGAIRAVNGKAAGVERTVDPEEAIALRRRRRDRKLTLCDWTQGADSPLDDQTKAAWATYRQALRDLDMNGTDWPTEPGAEDTVES